VPAQSEAKVKRDAEQRANEMRRAQVAAENARIELESKLARKSSAGPDTRDRLTREQLEKRNSSSCSRGTGQGGSRGSGWRRHGAEARPRRWRARVQAEPPSGSTGMEGAT
jgi:hypothetical protein